MPAHSFLAISSELRHRLGIACNAMVLQMTEILANERLLSRAEVVAATGLSSTTLWREVRAGRFPAALRLSPNRVGFLESSVLTWIRDRRAAAIDTTEDEAPIVGRQEPRRKRLRHPA